MHVPARSKTDRVNLKQMKVGEPIQLEPRLIANPGSVGQPRDRDPRAAYAIYDSTAKTWETAPRGIQHPGSAAAHPRGRTAGKTCREDCRGLVDCPVNLPQIRSKVGN